MAVLRSQLEIKADIKNIQRDVQYLHYLITRQSAPREQLPRAQTRDERLTQYVPCASIDELQNLNRKLETDAEFLRHSVRMKMKTFFRNTKYLALSCVCSVTD